MDSLSGDETDAEFTLYTCAGSRGLRATWAAAEVGLELGQDIALKMLPFPPRFKTEDYLEINPLGTVPLLVHGDVRMTESCAIAHYLVALKDRSNALGLIVTPEEADYGAYLDFTYHADATLTFPQTVFLRFTQFEKHKGLGEAGVAYARWFEMRLARAEERLEAREFLCSDRFTVADICVGYALFLARRIGLGDRLTPRLEEYWARLSKRAGFKAAMAYEKQAYDAAGLKAAL